MNNYFLNKNYAFLYLHVFGEKIGNRLLELFTGAVFYSLGMPLPFIFLFFGLEFGLRGALAPLAPLLATRIGTRYSMTLSYAFLVIFFTLVYLAHFSLILGFFSFVFQAISRAIYYPCLDTLHSVLVKDESRGRQYTLEIVLTLIAGLIAIAIGASALLHAFTLAAIGVALVLLLAIVPLFFLEQPDLSSNLTFTDAYRHLTSPAWRENLLPLGAESLAIIANVIIAPVFIYTLVKTPSTFSAVLIIGLAIESVSVLIYGAWLDKRGHKVTLWYASTFQSLGNIGYIFAPVVISWLPFLNGANNIAWDMFSSNYNTRIQQKAAKRSAPLLFNTASQMTLCFVEVVALCIFAIIAWIWSGFIAFIAVFLVSLVSLFMATKYFKD